MSVFSSDYHETFQIKNNKERNVCVTVCRSHATTPVSPISMKLCMRNLYKNYGFFSDLWQGLCILLNWILRTIIIIVAVVAASKGTIGFCSDCIH